MSRAGRDALWAKEKAERPYGKTADDALRVAMRIHAETVAEAKRRAPSRPPLHRPDPRRLLNRKTGWAVVKVNDDRRTLIYKWCSCQPAAMALAGKMRDRMSDDDVGAGWNYVDRFIGQRRK